MNGVIEQMKTLKEIDFKEKIEEQNRCPFGHKNIDFVGLGYHRYIFCYDCNRKFYEEDFN